MRLLPLLVVLAACRGGAYKLAVTDSYEVGEDVTVTVHVKEPSKREAQIVVTRPDGTEVRQLAPLDVATSRVRTGAPIPRPRTEATINAIGEYRVELRSKERVLAGKTIVVKTNRLDSLLPDEPIAGYTPILRFTRPKQSGKMRWKTYGALYEHPRNIEARIEIVIEEATKQAIDEAWQPYEEEGSPSVILGNNVRYRERSDGSVSTSWLSGMTIVSMKAPTLADLERGLIGHFLEKFPSRLGGS